jgi:predicted phage terminase large subunit-like protein
MVYRKEDIARKNILERKLNIAKRDLAFNSFYHYIKQAWDVIEGVPFVDNWHIGCIAEHLQYQLLGEKSLQKIIVNIQPRLCIEENQEVLMADGTYKPIKDVEIGEYVVGTNLQNEIVSTEVTNKWFNGVEPVYELITYNNSRILCTDNHKIHTTQGWKRLKELVVNKDAITCLGKQPYMNNHRYLASSLVRSITKLEDKCKVYDIETTEHNFFCEGIKVHNSKSVICSVMLPTWIWTHQPHYKILTISHSMDLAGMFTYNSRLLIESDWYGYWRDSLKFDLVKGDTRKTAYSNNKLGYRMSFGVGSKMAGYGGDYNILDDPNDLTEFNSATQKQNVIDTYKYTWKTRVTGQDTKWLLIQQRIPGGGDLTDYLLDNEGDDWFRLNIPTEYIKHFTFKSPIGKNDPRKEGDLVCPKRFSNYTTEKKDGFQWNAIFQQEPSSQGGNVLKEHWLQRYIVQPTEFDIEFISCDFALETNLNKADYTVFTYIGVKRGNFYVLDMYRDRVDFPTQLEEFRLFCAKYPKVELKLIEDKASGKAFKQMMQREMSGIIGVEIKNKSKEERLYTATPSIVSRKLHIPDNNYYEHKHKKWIEPLLDEYLNFPTGEHDDILDTIVQFINYYNQLFAGTEIVYVDTLQASREPIFKIEETYDTEKYRHHARPTFTESYESKHLPFDRGIGGLFR